MKKTILSLAIGLIASNLLLGQLNPSNLPANRKVNSETVQSLKNSHLSNSNRDIVDELFLDYSTVDNFNQGTTSESFQSYFWGFHSNNTSADTAISFVGVKFFELTGFRDLNDLSNTFVDPIDYAANYELIIDSIFVLLGHENNSGQDDSLIVEIHRLNPNGTFSNSPVVLWGDTAITNTSLSPGGNWIGVPFTYSLAPNVTVPVGRRAGVTVKYFGSKQDSIGIISSYISNPNSPAPPNDDALKSSLPYSVMKYPPFFSSDFIENSDVFYTPSPGQDTGYFYAQNWEIWVKARINEVLDIEKINGIQMGHAYPNPFSEITNFTFNLDKSAEIGVQMFDITGKLVYTENMGKKSAGKNNVSINAGNLPAGMYMYRITADGNASVSKKVTIVR